MDKKIYKLGAIVFSAILVSTTLFISAGSIEIEKNKIIENVDTENYDADNSIISDEGKKYDPMFLDRMYLLDDPFAENLNEDYDDAGYKRDAGDEISRSVPIYPGEPVDNTPGRGRTGKIRPGDEDWFSFSVCAGQQIEVTMTPPSGQNYDLALWDKNGDEIETSSNSGSSTESIVHTALMTNYYFINIYFVEGDGEGQYSFDVSFNNQNDADTGNDAGDDFSSATLIGAGETFGYLDMNDEEDWYKFQVDNGEGIKILLEMEDYSFYSDFDVYLYNPSGNLKHYETMYYDDELNFNADVSGEWRAQIITYPGFSNAPDPSGWNYFKYGSGAYKLDLTIGPSVPSPPGPISQPDITPIAQTFKVTNIPNSNDDEYGYLASIPACNFIKNGKRYVSPIVYTGDTTTTNWFGTVDDTTDYLLDDWNEYLSQNGKEKTVYNVDSDPIKAAADIATSAWESSNLAVVAVDGSDYKDTKETILQRSATLTRETEVKEVQSDGSEYSDDFGYSMFVGKKWGALTVEVFGIDRISHSDSGALLSRIFPGYIGVSGDDWPVPYDGTGDATDIYYPVVTMGLWGASSGMTTSSWDSLKVTKIAGDRYSFRVNNPDSTVKVKVETSQPSDLLVFLVDPQGHLRAPDIPTWVGPINPIHEWHGLENPSTNPWRSWEPDAHTEFSAEVLHPETGKWTAIVVPRYATGSSSISYTVTGELTKMNSKRVNAAVSASNAAVIASLEHVPLLYVKEDSIPSETQQAFTSLGVNKVIFVERNNIGSGVRNKLPTIQNDLKTMKSIVNKIKSYSKSENYITLTSMKSGDGYFAPSSMIAAYHGSPLLRIGDANDEISSSANRLFIGQDDENYYCLDLDKDEFVWSYPTGYTPSDDTHPGTDQYRYLGTTDDNIYCLDTTTGNLIWSYQGDYDGTLDVGSLYLDMDQCIVYCYDENDNELWNEPIGRSNVLNPAGMANRIDTWRLWDGDYYHGIRAPGHLPTHDEPLPSTINMIINAIKYLFTNGQQGELPPFGLDAKKLWNEEMYNGIHDYIKDLGLEKNGREAFLFVAPRKDIRIQAHAVMMGNNSYAGHIPGETPAYSSALINRNILYPALISVNDNKDVTTTQFMNYPDGGDWTLNNGEKVYSYSSRVVKRSFSSHNRIYDGHCLWDAHLKRLNDGSSVFYYAGHGTGGSGISAQYEQTDHSKFPEVIWPDAWRGYMYDNWKTARDNGRRWYNPEPPNLYDIIHYKWVDQLLQNLKSLGVFYMSCSTAQHFGPMVYLDHGALLWYGNAGSGLCPEADYLDDVFFDKVMIYGEKIGPAFAEEVWLHFRDFTTGDSTSMYGPSSVGSYPISTIQCIYGDPDLIMYSPDWEVPEPVDPDIDDDKSKPVNNIEEPVVDKPSRTIGRMTYLLESLIEKIPWLQIILRAIFL